MKRLGSMATDHLILEAWRVEDRAHELDQILAEQWQGQVAHLSYQFRHYPRQFMVAMSSSFGMSWTSWRLSHLPFSIGFHGISPIFSPNAF